MIDNLNIPIRILKEYKHSKASKECLAFAILLKTKYGDSSIKNVTTQKVMNVCHVSFAKAKRLIEYAKSDNKLFTVVENKITVNTFKDKELKYNRKGQSFMSDYCYKLPAKDYTFKEIYKLITIILIENTINASERKSLSTDVKKCGAEITQKQMANSTGVSRSYISKITKTLAKEDNEGISIITKNKAEIKLAMKTVNKDTILEFKKNTGRSKFIYNKKDGSAFYVIACRYNLVCRTETDKFKHVIYNQWNRIKSFSKSLKESASASIMDTELMGAYC